MLTVAKVKVAKAARLGRPFSRHPTFGAMGGKERGRKDMREPFGGALNVPYCRGSSQSQWRTSGLPYSCKQLSALSHVETAHRILPIEKCVCRLDVSSGVIELNPSATPIARDVPKPVKQKHHAAFTPA
jgi:hypothetical protein